MRISKVICTGAIVSIFCVSMWGQATPAPAKNWKNQAEFDLYDSITKESSPAKRLETLNSWKEKYAETDYKKERLLFYLTTYAQLQQNPKVIETAKQILTIDPADFTSLYFITNLTPAVNDTSAGALDTGEKAAQGVMANLDVTFTAAKKPAATSDADWTKARSDAELTAHKTLAWIAIARKQNDVAQQEYKKILALTPNDAAVIYALAQTIQLERKLERQSEVLFYYARSFATEGPGALAPDFRNKLNDYLTGAYQKFHGSADGLDELKKLAKTNAVPPPDFKIKSVKDLAEEEAAKDAELKKNNPQLAIWTGVKTALTAADGAQYFETGVKGAGFPKMKGKLVSQNPAIKPKTLVVAISDNTTPEVTLNLSAPLAGKADAGTEIQWEGVPSSFTASPFMLTMDVEKEQIEGWPVQAAPAARRPGAGAKAGGTKKK